MFLQGLRRYHQTYSPIGSFDFLLRKTPEMTKVPATMRRLAILFSLLAVLSAPANAQDFVPGFEDLPLMRGLSPIAGSGHVFDSPAGRLVESHARGAVTRADVITFYRESLAALGWSETGPGQFRRENEILRIEAAGRDGNLQVLFRLAPDRR